MCKGKMFTSCTCTYLWTTNVNYLTWFKNVQKLQYIQATSAKLCQLYAHTHTYIGGGGFFHACENFGRMLDFSFPTCAFFFFLVEISSHKLIPLFSPGSVYRGSASWDDCDRVFPEELRVSSFLVRFLNCLDSSKVRPLWLRWVKGVCVFRCNLTPALLAEWPGSCTSHCGDTGVERTPNKSQHMSWLEKKILPPLLPGFELATFRSRVWRSN